MRMRVAVDTNGLFTGQAGGARYIRGLLAGLKHVCSEVDWFEFAWPVENLEYGQPKRALKTFYRELVWSHAVAPVRLRRSGATLYHATGSYFVAVPQSIHTVVT